MHVMSLRVLIYKSNERILVNTKIERRQAFWQIFTRSQRQGIIHDCVPKWYLHGAAKGNPRFQFEFCDGVTRWRRDEWLDWMRNVKSNKSAKNVTAAAYYGVN